MIFGNKEELTLSYIYDIINSINHLYKTFKNVFMNTQSRRFMSIVFLLIAILVLVLGQSFGVPTSSVIISVAFGFGVTGLIAALVSFSD